MIDLYLDQPFSIALNASSDDQLLTRVRGGSNFQAHHCQTLLTPPCLGVQFHPELTVAMMKLLMDAMPAKYAAASIDLGVLDAGLGETAEGP